MTIPETNGEKTKPHGSGQAKWFGLVNDTIIPAPQRRLPASVLRAQAGVPADHSLLRDHNSPRDVIIDPHAEIDLGLGNVFYTRPGQCERPETDCESPAKLAWAVDDRPEVTVRPSQTGKSLRELFGLAESTVLFRDFESPMDQEIKDDDSLTFTEGPVFISRKVQQFCLNIEDKIYSWAEPKISTSEIRQLGHLPADQSVVWEDGEGRERTLREDEVIELETCCRIGRAPKYKRG
jgi:hypothetical protein